MRVASLLLGLFFCFGVTFGCVPDHHLAAPSDGPVSDYASLLSRYLEAVGCERQPDGESKGERANL